MPIKVQRTFRSDKSNIASEVLTDNLTRYRVASFAAKLTAEVTPFKVYRDEFEGVMVCEAEKPDCMGGVKYVGGDLIRSI
ncbi:MAG: hypothetical protein ACUVTP_10855 [Candidatus Fervidibacter sp.]|uniref:hypothetical protein n=1 Tax=Candidatus Fervidibacter sp. TaxID=3100871 RepID=UPI00404A9655